MTNLTPAVSLKKAATKYPKMRILEYGLYAKYLKVWQERIPADRFRIIFFEDQIVRNWDQTLCDTYEYLRLEPTFKPQHPAKPRHRSWGWTRILFNYYASKIYKNAGQSRVAHFLDRHDFLSSMAIKKEDIEFLRSVYLAEKAEISAITGNDLSCWDYGAKLLN